MKIILRADVRDLGVSGELVEVKAGYARNYLLPRNLAVTATAGNVKDFQKRINAAKEREEKERAAGNAVADELRGRRFVMIVRAVEGGTRIHGSITTPEIAAAIGKELGRTIDRRDLDLRQPIRALGEYQVNYKVMRGLTVPLRILVTDREPVEEPEVPDVAEAPAAEAAASAEEPAPAEEAA
jgi:large subunit ribosomal protein L9